MARSSDWRAAHGNAAKHGAMVVLEMGRDRDLPAASGSDTDPAQRSKDGRFAPGNKLARLGKARAGVHGALAALEATADPFWRAARRGGRRAAKHRITEFTQAHGADLSSGVCALICEAAEMRADASYLRARAAQDNDPELLRIAATIAAGARQSERDAWEFAAREAEARKTKNIGRDRWLRPAQEPTK